MIPVATATYPPDCTTEYCHDLWTGVPRPLDTTAALAEHLARPLTPELIADLETALDWSDLI